MIDISSELGFLRELVLPDLLMIAAIIVASRLLVVAARWILTQAAEAGPSRLRLRILAWPPKLRLLIDIGTLMAILPIIVEPTFQNTIALITTIGIALAFAFKDYGSCLIAGLVTIVENTYQPGDWIEVNGIYGEVKLIGMRAVYLTTNDDTEVMIPHSQLWTATISNATAGSRSVLCVAEFHLDPDHDVAPVRQRLVEIAAASAYLKPDSEIRISVLEKPWGTLYRLKANVKESRNQFLMVSDLTERGKAALREMKVGFAAAPYAVTGKR